jgi:predicted HicB family RNase H-like nuclease
MMKYKGYVGISEVDEDSGLIFGEVVGLRDVVTYQGRTADEARKSFTESIDLYLRDMCRRRNCARQAILRQIVDPYQTRRAPSARSLGEEPR